MTLPGDPLTPALQAVVGEVEGHVAEAGWDQPPQLFALVQTEQLLRAEPQLAQTMGLVAGDPSSLTPIAQEPLGDGPLDEQLASLVFGEEVLGVVLAHEVLVLPPSAEQSLEDVEDLTSAAAEHPDRREVRMVVGVARGGGTACVLRLRGTDDAADERVTGPDLAPALSAALLATLED
ncbi:MAG: hypothetical protein JWN08_2797 [Frankiales bacterium]|nr:hypothetical protein [Frankiales bacterium]